MADLRCHSYLSFGSFLPFCARGPQAHQTHGARSFHDLRTRYRRYATCSLSRIAGLCFSVIALALVLTTAPCRPIWAVSLQARQLPRAASQSSPSVRGNSPVINNKGEATPGLFVVCFATRVYLQSAPAVFTVICFGQPQLPQTRRMSAKCRSDPSARKPVMRAILCHINHRHRIRRVRRVQCACHRVHHHLCIAVVFTSWLCLSPCRYAQVAHPPPRRP